MAPTLAVVRVPLRDDVVRVERRRGTDLGGRALPQRRELHRRRDDPSTRERRGLLQPEGVALRVLGLELEVPQIPAVVVARPLGVDLEAGSRQHPTREQREQLILVVVARRIVGRHQAPLAHGLEDQEVVAEREPVRRDLAVEHPGDPQIQAVDERRTVRDGRSGDVAARLRDRRIEPIRLAEPAPDPLGLQLADPDVHGRTGPQKAVRDSRGVVAQEDRVADPGSPPEAPGAHPEAHTARVDADLGLPGMEGPHGVGPEPLGKVDLAPRIGVDRHVRDGDRSEVERGILRDRDERIERHGERPPAEGGPRLERAREPLALPDGAVVAAERIARVGEEPQAGAREREPGVARPGRIGPLDEGSPRSARLDPREEAVTKRPDHERAGRRSAGELQDPDVVLDRLSDRRRLSRRACGRATPARQPRSTQATGATALATRTAHRGSPDAGLIDAGPPLASPPRPSATTPARAPAPPRRSRGRRCR